MSRMSRRAFLGFRFSEEDAGTRDVPGGVPPETPLPPEFSPAMLRATDCICGPTARLACAALWALSA